MADKYPEHDKLRKVAGESQAIGEFLDFGLPEQHLVLYERIVRDCECHACKRRRGAHEGMHTPEEMDDAVNGKVQIVEYRPAQRTIQSILAEHFDIDQDKIAAEKEQMLAAMRKANA